MLGNREALILLNMIEGLGPAKIVELLNFLKEPSRIFSLSLKSLSRIPPLDEKFACSIVEKRASSLFLEELKEIDKEKIEIITLLDEDYPFLLRQISSPPPLLYLKGKRKLLNERCLAIVGSRRASFYGLKEAEKFSYQLSSLGLVIVSGLARGIDTSAHKGALRGGGLTIAVLGSGFLNLYPKENKRLFERIGKEGCVVSEFPLFKPPFRENFPRRNRIISGLSLGVLVVEAALRSGALITANFALEQGREVFALPGKIDSAQSKGTHLLIKEGAKLVENIEDIIGELNITIEVRDSSGDTSARTNLKLSSEEESIFKILNSEPRNVEYLLAKSGLDFKRFTHALFSLQLKHLIKELPGKTYVRL